MRDCGKHWNQAIYHFFTGNFHKMGNVDISMQNELCPPAEYRPEMVILFMLSFSIFAERPTEKQATKKQDRLFSSL